ncbi:Arc family DNA-binding protein [Massilia pseudoviolaceinigra]|uniref:Arc family DNA-binding protein n=1 Tax=Massilia pseudoviolaceinigra TaxID=3057165 RepID=UPI0035B54EB5
MTSPIPPFGLRLPPDLKKWLAEQAALNRRSLNSEITKRLEDSRALQSRKHKQKSCSLAEQKSDAD